MQELLLLAKSKGFQARTFSTIWTFRGFIGEGKKIVINKDCESNLLCEIQRWLREVHKIDAFVNPIETMLFETRSYQSRVFTKTSVTIGGVYDSYEKALEVALESALKLIK